MSESSGSQGGPLFVFLVGTGVRSATVGYLWPSQADFSESRQIVYLAPVRHIFKEKKISDLYISIKFLVINDLNLSGNSKMVKSGSKGN